MMTRIWIIALVLIFSSGIHAQEAGCVFCDSTQLNRQVSNLDSVRMPAWRIHMGIFSLPVLNASQQMKMRYNNIALEITELEQDIKEKQILLIRKKKERFLFLNGELVETRSGSLMLGLFRHRKKIKGIETIYNEKSLFWGAVKWGARQPEKELPDNQL